METRDLRDKANHSSPIENTSNQAFTENTLYRTLPEEGSVGSNLPTIVVTQQQIIPEKESVGSNLPPIVVTQQQLLPEKESVGSNLPSIVVTQQQLLPDKGCDGSNLPSIVVTQQQIIPEKGSVGSNLPSIVVTQQQLIPENGSVRSNLPSIVVTQQQTIPDKGSVGNNLPSIVVTQQQIIPEKGSVGSNSPPIVVTQQQLIPEKGSVGSNLPPIVVTQQQLLPEKGSVGSNLPPIVVTQQQLIPEKGSVGSNSPTIVVTQQQLIPEKGSVRRNLTRKVVTQQQLNTTQLSSNKVIDKAHITFSLDTSTTETSQNYYICVSHHSSDIQGASQDSSDVESNLFSSDGESCWEPSSSYDSDNIVSDINTNERKTGKSGLTAVHRGHKNPSKPVSVKLVDKSKPYRVWDKKDVCMFCNNEYIKLTQHLLVSHSTEQQVIDCFNAPKNSSERATKIKIIRNKGNYLHNMTVLDTKEGDLLVCRRPAKPCKPEDFLPCPYCYGFYLSKNLFRHASKCSECPKSIVKKTNVKTMASFLIPTPANGKALFNEKVVSRMRVDEKTNFVKNDETLVSFGAKLITKYINQPRMVNEISQKLRTLASFMMTIKTKYPNLKCIKDILMPEAFPIVLENATEMFLNCQEPKPTTAIKIGQNLRKCTNILIVNAITSNNKLMRSKLEDFIVLYQNEWISSIAEKANSIIHCNRFNAPLGIPNEKDVLCLNKYIVKLESEFISAQFQNVEYSKLVKNTLAHIITFNRRRVGEVQSLTIKAYFNIKKCTQPQGEIEELLNEKDKERGSSLLRVEVVGKKGGRVPILLTKNMVKCIEHILKTRSAHSVPTSNIYVFGLPFSQNPFRGSDAIRETAQHCGAEDLSFLNSRGLRKHISTVAQLFNLKQNELDCLVGYMGHSLAVHKQYYQMPEEMMQKTQISKILIALEQGKTKKLVGKTLDNFSSEIDDTTIETNHSQVPETIGTENIHQLTYRYGNQEKRKEEKQSDSRDSEEENDTDYDEPVVKKRKINMGRVIWSFEEKELILKHFRTNILNKRTPGKADCEGFKQKYSQFKNVPWTRIKYLVYNQWSRKILIPN